MGPTPRLKRMAMFPSFAVVFRHYRNRYASAENRPQVIARILSALNRNGNNNNNDDNDGESDVKSTCSSSTSYYSYAEAVNDRDLDKVLAEVERKLPYKDVSKDISAVVAYAAAESMDMKLSRIAIASILLPRIISSEYRLYPVAVWALNAAKYVCEKEALRELSFSDDRLEMDYNMEIDVDINVNIAGCRILPSPFPKAPVSDQFLQSLVKLPRRTFYSGDNVGIGIGDSNRTRMSMSLAIANQFVAANARGGSVSIELRVSIFIALLALVCALSRAKITRISTSLSRNRGPKVLSFKGGSVHVEVLGTGPVIIVLRKRRFMLPKRRHRKDPTDDSNAVVDEIMEGLMEFKNGLSNAKTQHIPRVEYPSVRI